MLEERTHVKFDLASYTQRAATTDLTHSPSFGLFFKAGFLIVTEDDSPTLV